jgi:toxin-antitoxin system PIN domain toxin
MVAVDTNILVYAHRRDSPWNRKAAGCLVSLAQAASPWAIPWPCVHEFLAVVTHPRIFRPATPVSRAIADLEVWFESPSLRLIGEDSSYWPHLRELVESGAATGSMIHDARVAAICRAHGVKTLLTADRDFSRFSGLDVRNPL